MKIIDKRDNNRKIRISISKEETFEKYLQNPNELVLSNFLEGRYEFILNGKKRMLEAPFLACLSSDDRFHMVHKSKNAVVQTFLFEPLFLNSSLTEENLEKDCFDQIEDEHDRNLVNLFRKHDDFFDGIVSLDYFTYQKLKEWFNIIITEAQIQSDGRWTCRIRRYLLQILYIFEDIREEKNNSEDDYTALFYKIIKYIHSNYNHSISQNDICKAVNTNRTTLNQVCKLNTGKTALQYLLFYRIEMAKDALWHTNLVIKEIAACCGYKNEAYFTFRFEKMTGETPSQFRKRVKEEQIKKNEKL